VPLFTHGIEVEWSRDVAGRPTARRTFKRSLAAAAMGFAVGMLATPSFAQPQREEVDARVYQWRGEDQIAGIVDAASGPKFYDHDGRGRLVRERRPDAVVERAMDAVGNVYRSRTGSDRRYGPGGRLEMADGVRYEHDEDGNQTLKSGPDGDWHYRWNGHGMLREVERPDGIRVAFEYDPFARRTVKRTLSATGTIDREVDFVWDGHNVIHELDSERGLVSWQWEPESFTPIAKEHAGRRWTIASDHLGTPTEMYDDLCQLAWKMQLDVFGVPSFEAGTAEDCPWRWPGQYEDGGIGLFYNRWRYYAAHLGSFSSQDPLGVEPSTRLMGYPTDPTTHVDPSGLTAEALRAAMEAERGSALGNAMTPHHIVEESASGWAERSRDLLTRNGLHWDDAANGASLFGTHPNRVAASGMTRPQLRATGRYHAGVHLHRYGGNDEAQRMIYRILRGAERRGPAAVEAALRDIGRRMEAGTWRSSYAAAGGKC
jgi:RHS repeat-associated protein